MGIAAGIDQLTLTRTFRPLLHRAFEHVRDLELPRDLRSLGDALL